MKLNLKKPLVIFDLETTGLDLVKDRVIQLSYIKVYPDGREERGNEILNPERPIDPFITQLTGISDDDVRDKSGKKSIVGCLLRCKVRNKNKKRKITDYYRGNYIRIHVEISFSAYLMPMLLYVLGLQVFGKGNYIYVEVALLAFRSIRL